MKDSRLVIYDYNGTVKVFDLTTFKCLKQFTTTYSEIGTLMQLKDSQLMSVSFKYHTSYSSVQIWKI